jgi:hypothetical protein
MTKLKQTRKENNLCVYCGKSMDRKGIYCISCNDRWNNFKFNNYTLKLHNENKCTDCGKILDREGWFCLECAAKLRIRGKELATYRRENNLCVQCGIPVIGYRYCQKCRDARMEKYYTKKNKAR